MSDSIGCSRSRASGKLVFPAVPSEGAAAPLYEPASTPNLAKLYSFTTIHPNPKTGEPAFSLGYADFSDELRVFGKLKLAAGEMPQIGMALKLEPQADPEAIPAYFLIPAKG